MCQTNFAANDAERVFEFLKPENVKQLANESAALTKLNAKSIGKLAAATIESVVQGQDPLRAVALAIGAGINIGVRLAGAESLIDLSSLSAPQSVPSPFGHDADIILEPAVA